MIIAKCVRLSCGLDFTTLSNNMRTMKLMLRTSQETRMVFEKV